MIKYIYCYKRKAAGFYSDPIISVMDVEQFKDTFIQGSFNIPKENENLYKDAELFYLGTFDNIQGIFEYKSEFILDCSEVLALTALSKQKMEEAKNGKKS